MREHKLKSAEQKQIDEEIISFSDNQEKDIRILKYASMTIEVMNECKLRLQKKSCNSSEEYHELFSSFDW